MLGGSVRSTGTLRGCLLQPQIFKTHSPQAVALSGDRHPDVWRPTDHTPPPPAPAPHGLALTAAAVLRGARLSAPVIEMANHPLMPRHHRHRCRRYRCLHRRRFLFSTFILRSLFFRCFASIRGIFIDINRHNQQLNFDDSAVSAASAGAMVKTPAPDACDGKSLGEHTAV